LGGQGVERREILRYIGIASVAATFPGFKQWAFACAHAHDAPAFPQTPSGAYKPLFFSSQHFQMVEHLAEMIIPEDDTPGAKSAGVAEFIDFMVANRVPVSASRLATESGRAFFQLMRDYTVVGYYTTKVGLESLGYPGLRSVWPKMPACSHPDDPEHANLREPATSRTPVQTAKD
jgi:hypothetical protein